MLDQIVHLTKTFVLLFGKVYINQGCNKFDLNWVKLEQSKNIQDDIETKHKAPKINK